MHAHGTPIYVRAHSAIINPYAAHIPKEDGGHLLVMPKRCVSDRTQLTAAELLEIDYLTIISASILRHFLGVNWINYQENGNWSLDESAVQHMHFHVYGRKRGSQSQAFGEALRFPLKGQKHLVSFPPFAEGQVREIQLWITAFRKADSNVQFERAIEALGDSMRSGFQPGST
ncbi:MAG TPA: hypothetical protein VG734_14525 [Lacunisphaera sp.]|nr:hypothetical protein [Lacunisphaera sp.]